VFIVFARALENGIGEITLLGKRRCCRTPTTASEENIEVLPIGAPKTEVGDATGIGVFSPTPLMGSRNGPSWQGGWANGV
jgi:hypothetical protein